MVDIRKSIVSAIDRIPTDGRGSFQELVQPEAYSTVTKAAEQGMQIIMSFGHWFFGFQSYYSPLGFGYLTKEKIELLKWQSVAKTCDKSELGQNPEQFRQDANHVLETRLQLQGKRYDAALQELVDTIAFISAAILTGIGALFGSPVVTVIGGVCLILSGIYALIHSGGNSIRETSIIETTFSTVKKEFLKKYSSSPQF